MSREKPKVIFVIPDMSWLYDYKQQFSLGILYLSTVLKKEGCTVEIYDTNINHIHYIPKADIYGFSAVHSTYESCVSLASEIPHTEALRIIGGTFPTLEPEKIDPVFDIVFKGEAEDTITEFITHYINFGNTMRSLYEMEEDVSVANIIPDRGLLPDDYVRTKSIFTDEKSYAEGGATSIMFSRGCPHRCTFCASSNLYHHRVRMRPVESVVEEIKGIIETYGIRQFRVQDDTFTGSKKHFIKLAKALEPLGIFYRCSTRANHIDTEVAEWLYKSGCREVGLGIEVADDVILKQMKKGVTVKQMEEAIYYLKSFPMMVRCFFMIGLPTDSYETMQANIDFIERNNVDNIMTSNFIPFPGTEMHSFPEKFNIAGIKEGEFTCLSLASHIKLAPNILRKDISQEEHTKIMKVFYDYSIKKGFIH